MSTKHTRSGGKYTGSHSTVIPEAGKILDEIHKCTFVKKISLGIIKSTNRRGGNGVRLHATPLDPPIHGIRLTIAKGGSLQIILLYLETHARLDYVLHRLHKLV